MNRESRRFGCLALVTSLAGLLLTGGCGGSNSPTAPTPPPSGGGGGGSATVTLSMLQTQVFSARCTSCHGGPGGQEGLNLAAGSAHGSLVNVASAQKPGAIRVIPGDPDNSYLVQKLRGDAGIVGLRMPRNGPPFLSDDQINLVRQWIQQGAPNN